MKKRKRREKDIMLHYFRYPRLHLIAFSPSSSFFFFVVKRRSIRLSIYHPQANQHMKSTTGHCKNLAKIPNLWCVSSVDTLKKAQLLDRYRGEFISSLKSSSTSSPSSSSPSSSLPSATGLAPELVPGLEKLNIHVQVNTSGEASKSGCAPGAETVALCRAVETAPNLRLLGLMTIGAIARSVATTAENENENDDFVALREQRDLVMRELGLGGEGEGEGEGEGGRMLELSMGMSEDFEGAVAMGSDEVRVGSTIFGARPSRAEAKIRE